MENLKQDIDPEFAEHLNQLMRKSRFDAEIKNLDIQLSEYHQLIVECGARQLGLQERLIYE